jgi:hypothetical protein
LGPRVQVPPVVSIVLTAGDIKNARGGTMNSNERELFKIAERATNETMGAGTYERLNHFSPARGEFHAGCTVTDKVCPECGGKKAFGAVMCMTCRVARRGKPKYYRPRLTAQQMDVLFACIAEVTAGEMDNWTQGRANVLRRASEALSAEYNR